MEPLFTRLALLLQPLGQILLPYLDTTPFAFFGHSMGALISFELARHLRRQNFQCPLHLFVSSRRAPQIPSPDPPIHTLPEPMFLKELRRLNGTPETILQDAELMQLILPILRADTEMCETHVYSTEKPLENTAITALGGLEDRDLANSDLAAWRYQTHCSFKLRMFPGNHFFLHSAQAILLRFVAQDLTHHLSR